MLYKCCTNDHHFEYIIGEKLGLFFFNNSLHENIEIVELFIILSVIVCELGGGRLQGKNGGFVIIVNRVFHETSFALLVDHNAVFLVLLRK